MDLKGSQTESNLLTAFLIESSDRSRYTFYAKEAEKDGYHYISRIFDETAEHERIHAKNFFRHLPGGTCEIKARFHSGEVKATEENLKMSIEIEREESASLYPGFAQIARREGFEEIARLFLNILVAEQMHEKRFRKLLKQVEEGKVWKRDEPVIWVCAKCGFTIESTEPQGKCPACFHPKEYFEVMRENC